MVKEGEEQKLGNPTYSKWLLDAIHKIRSQKQRPNVDRICHAVRQFHKVSNDSIIEQLELAVRDGTILKVISKGICSYRDPDSSHRKRVLKVGCKTDLTKYIIRSIKDVDKDVGLSLKQIEKHVQETYNVETIETDLIKQLKVSMKKGISLKKLTKDGRFIKLGEKATTVADLDTTGSVQSTNEDEFSSGDFSFTFEVEDKICPPVLICSFCLGDEKKNRDGKPEELISCAECGNSGHPSCLQFSPELTECVKKQRWQCIECKKCSFCRKVGREDNMLFCDSCDRGFHMDCCDPPISKAPKGQWSCNICEPERGNKKGKKFLEMSEKFRKKYSKLLKNPKQSQQQTSPKKCPTPGCDGSGNINGRSLHHRKQYQCPKLPPNQRPPRKKGAKPGRKKLNLNSDDSSDSSADEEGAQGSCMPPGVSQEDIDLFKQAQDNAQDLLNKEMAEQRKKEKERLESLGQSESQCSTPGPAPGTPGPAGSKPPTSTPGPPSTKPLPTTPGPPSIKPIPGTPGPPSSKPSTPGPPNSKLPPTTPGPSTSSGSVFSPSQGRFPPCIEFGKYEITTWYSSPYPQEYARLPKLYICEFCLKYMKSRSVLQRHMNKCDLQHPPANEIYRNSDLSVFEVDGNVSKMYCQNLCLLAKLFLDHKTLYYDVEPFLFYVLTYNDDEGCHLVGYFSKEKHCQQKYNVSCIMTMPQCQRRGYGRFLIDFSYLLSRREGQAGSPEKPLSDLGKVSYQAYWRSVVIEYLAKCPDDNITIKSISRTTGMCPQDIAQTLHVLNMIQYKNEKVVILVDKKLLTDHMEKLNTSNHKRLSLDEDSLRWTPLISSQALMEEEKQTENELKKMSKLVNSIAEDGLQLTLDLSPRKDGLESPRYRSPMKEVLEVTHSPVKNSFPSPEEAVKTPPKKRRGRKRRLTNQAEEEGEEAKRSRLESDAEDLVTDSVNESTILEVDHSNNAGTDVADSTLNSTLNSALSESDTSPKRRPRGWPKGVPRGVKKTVTQKVTQKTVTQNTVTKTKTRKRKWKRTVLLPKKQKKHVPLDRRRPPGRPRLNKSSAIKRSFSEEKLSEKENTDSKSRIKLGDSDIAGSNIPNGDVDFEEMEHSVKIETDSGGRITRSDSRTSSLRFGKSTHKSDVDSDLEDHNTSSESLQCNVNIRGHDVEDHRHETCTNRSSPSSTEGIRENNTPDLPIHVPSPLPVLPESGSDCVSDSISEDVPSLTPQVPTPHSLESGDNPHSVECANMEESNMNSPSINSPRSCVPSPTPSPIPQEPTLREDETLKQEACETANEQTHESEHTENTEQNNDNMAASTDDVLATVDSILSPVNTDQHEESENCEQILADSSAIDSSAIASSDLVAEMENEINNSNEECDEIDNDNSTGDIPSDDNFQDLDSDTTTQEALRATENLAQVIAAADLESSLEQMEESAATSVTTEQIMQHEENVNIASVGSASVPSVEPPPMSDPPNPSPRHPLPSPHNTVSPHHPSPHHPGPSPHHPSPHHTLTPHPNLSPQCIPMSMGQMFSQSQQMNTMPSVSISNNRFSNEIDVSQLAGLESPASISSNEMQNTSGDNLQPPQQQQQHHRPQQQQQQQQQQLTHNTFPDCAQAQPQFPSNVQFSSNYMDTVNQAMIGNTYMPIVSSPAINFGQPQNFTGVLIQQPNQTQRLSHNNTPCPPNVTRQVTVGTFAPGGQNSCSLQKLQQLTNGLMDIPDNMTPPPNLTPPPSQIMTPPTSMMRTISATPVPVQQPSQQQYRQYQRQKSSGSSSGRSKNTNIAMNPPNVSFSPNVTIQPSSNMIPRYNLMEMQHRMQQPMINPGYITNTSFISPLRQNLPMQMGLNMNMNPMNMNPINAINPQQHFQQHMQSQQSNNMYTTYGYLNGGLSNTLNMNNVMRR